MLLFLSSTETHPNPYRLLRHFIARIPPESQNEICTFLMQLGWNYVTANDMQSKLLPYRSPTVWTNGSTSADIATYSAAAATVTNGNASNNSNAVCRDLKSSWRLKAAPLSSSPPPLPKYRYVPPRDTTSGSYEEYRKLVSIKQQSDTGMD